MRPHVICHMVGPLDSRLMVQPWAPQGSSDQIELGKLYQRLHADFAADAWMAGTTTMEDFATGKQADARTPVTAQKRPWRLADANACHFAIAIDRHARLHWAKPVADGGHVVVVLGASVSDAHLAALAAVGVSYLVMPSDEIDLDAMLSELHSRLGIRKILLEGGGRINGAFLKAGVVDEVSLLVWPAIDGTSGASTVFETGDSSVGQLIKLSLLKATPLEHGAVHLQYSVRKRQEP